MINDVMIKDLKTFSDERGLFREVIRGTDEFFAEGFAQMSHTLTHVGTAKAWHYHKKQIDWWYVVSGSVKAVLHDVREDSSTYRETQEIFLGENYEVQVLKIPTGVAHGYKVLSGPMNLIYVTSQVYDPNDEFRLSPDDPEVGYDWRTVPIK